MTQEERYKIINGDSLKVLDTIEPNSIDAIVTDPPYGLTSITKRFGKQDSKPNQFGKDGSFARLTKGFMGKEWDGSGIEYNVELWAKALKVLKPGGYLLAFGGTRTYHRIACAIEDAGFEIRDTIMWLYGSGFPKSMNIGLMLDKKNGVESKVVGTFEIKQAQNEWAGWGTALKPAYEPVIVARKPVENSVLENVEKYGVGGINIDECRVGDLGGVKKVDIEPNSGSKNCGFGCNGKREPLDAGRFPANVILTYDETDFDEVCGGMPDTNSAQTPTNDNKQNNGNSMFIDGIHNPENSYNDSGNACRYFYCAKASKKDRDSGLIYLEEKGAKELLGREENSGGAVWNDKYSSGNAFAGAGSPKKNIHPTVKPVELMQYLVRLVTPRGGQY